MKTLTFFGNRFTIHLWKPVNQLKGWGFMNSEKIVLNFLVFADQLASGKSQADLLPKISELGFTQVELRREYFNDIEKEIPVIEKEAKRLGLQLFYSVPDEIYLDGTINPKLIQYVNEAKKMGVKHIKWNIGDFTGSLYPKELQAILNEGIEISIENDQTQTSGTLTAITTYLDAVKKAGLPIGYVYDLGNWRFVGEDEGIAANKLSDQVRYIHVKDVRSKGQEPQVVGLDEGEIDWRHILKILPSNVPIAIEYPTKKDSEILKAKDLLEAENND